VRKVFRPVGIIFKGSGFHVTDYRKPEKPAKKEPAKSASSKDKGSD
jgi:predicted nucleic acid-binding Zn ribbon protein